MYFLCSRKKKISIMCNHIFLLVFAYILPKENKKSRWCHCDVKMTGKYQNLITKLSWPQNDCTVTRHKIIIWRYFDFQDFNSHIFENIIFSARRLPGTYWLKLSYIYKYIYFTLFIKNYSFMTSQNRPCQEP